jgi:uncharacterized cupin superfamily protein
VFIEQGNGRLRWGAGDWENALFLSGVIRPSDKNGERVTPRLCTQIGAAIDAPPGLRPFD